MSDTPPATPRIADPVMQAYLDFLRESGAPPMETMTIDEARDAFAQVQALVEVPLPPADVVQRTIPFQGGELPLTIVRPTGAAGLLPGFLFFHGGGWVIGDYPIHERVVRELVVRSGAAAVFVHYSRAPEAPYPIANQQAYAALQWVAAHGDEVGVDRSRLAVVGNSAGGNMATVTALRAKLEKGPNLCLQLLLWPAVAMQFDTPSFAQFQDGYALTGAMVRWFCDLYLPNAAARSEIFAAPLQASLEQLAGLPPTLLLSCEYDVLRDEAEAYARKLSAAGVPVASVRINDALHDFLTLNPLHQSPAVETVLDLAAAVLRRHLR